MAAILVDMVTNQEYDWGKLEFPEVGDQGMKAKLFVGNNDVKMVSNHLLLGLILHAIFKANSQSTPLILCNLNPESTNSKQE